MKLTHHVAAIITLAVMATSAPALQAQGVSQPKSDRSISINYINTVTNDYPARKTAKGIIIIGSGKNIRALEPFSGSRTSGHRYAEAANQYKRVLGDKVNVYCMPIPTAAAFYTPEAAKSMSRDEKTNINGIFEHLSDSVYAVDIYTPLSQHAAEHIYSRTDHHWAPLGGYYAAQKLAQVAGVPFKDLSHYDSDTIRPYVGTMKMFSGDASLGNYPEDFIYYTPRGISYKTTYINYSLRGQKVVGEKAPTEGKFFCPAKGTGAYCTFMGGDAKIVKVQTGTHNGRRIVIIKDSFGNAVPGYLFFSFEEVHVIDSRYFTRNIKQYVEENKITDVVLANNVTHIGMATINKNIIKYLTQ